MTQKDSFVILTMVCLILFASVYYYFQGQSLYRLSQTKLAEAQVLLERSDKLLKEVDIRLNKANCSPEKGAFRLY